MRGGWTVTPAVSANRNMDVVHRAVGKPGVVLVGEGSPNRLPSLLAAEKKRISRVAYETPIYDFQVGNEEGQVPIRKLQRKIMRLPRNLKGADGDRAELPAQGPAAVPPGAEGPDAEVGPDAPAAPAPDPLAAAAAPAASPGASSRITMVLAARSCSPRRSRSVTSGGITAISSSVRTRAQPNPDRPAVQPGHPDAQHPLAQGEPGQRGEQVDLARRRPASVQPAEWKNASARPGSPASRSAGRAAGAPCPRPTGGRAREGRTALPGTSPGPRGPRRQQARPSVVPSPPHGTAGTGLPCSVHGRDFCPAQGYCVTGRKGLSSRVKTSTSCAGITQSLHGFGEVGK